MRSNSGQSCTTIFRIQSWYKADLCYVDTRSIVSVSFCLGLSFTTTCHRSTRKYHLHWRLSQLQSKVASLQQDYPFCFGILRYESCLLDRLRSGNLAQNVRVYASPCRSHARTHPHSERTQLFFNTHSAHHSHVTCSLDTTSQAPKHYQERVSV